MAAPLQFGETEGMAILPPAPAVECGWSQVFRSRIEVQTNFQMRRMNIRVNLIGLLVTECLIVHAGTVTAQPSSSWFAGTYKDQLLALLKAERQRRIDRAPRILCEVRAIRVYDNGLTATISFLNQTNSDVRIWQFEPIFNGLGDVKLSDDNQTEWGVTRLKADYHFGAPTKEKTFLIEKGKRTDLEAALILEDRKFLPKGLPSEAKVRVPAELKYEIGHLTCLFDSEGERQQEVYLMGEGRVRIESVRGAISLLSSSKIVGTQPLTTQQSR